jgi:predicted ATPase
VTALVTSRSRLRITGEHTYLVPPLSLPGTEVADVTVARRHGAVGLFVDRAQAAAGHFKLTADNVAAVIEICRRLDGLPLSIELAAAKVRVLPPAAILDRLGCGLDLLTGGDRDRPVRQQTLRSTIAWSHDLVPRREQNLFARLAVFDGGFELRAVESIATRFAGDDTDVLECLGALVDNSLVKQEPAVSGAPRFRMLDSVREYALERLHDSGEWSVAHHAHAEWYLALGLEAETHLNQSAEPEWLDRLEVEHDNLNSATNWFLDEQQPDLALRLGEAIWVFSWLHGHIDEAMRYLGRIFERSERLSPYSRGRALLATGAMSLASGDFARGESQLVSAREMLCNLGDDVGVARADGPLAHVAIVRHDYARAREYLEEARLISERTGEHWQISLYHSRMAMIALDDRRYSDAEAHLLDALTVGRRTQERLGTVVALYGLAVSAFAQGDAATARARLTEGLSYAHRTGDRNSPALFLQALAEVEARDDPERAARLAAAARSLRTRSGMIWLNAYVPPWPTSPVDLRVELGDARFERADSEGAALCLERAVALVQTAPDDLVSSSSVADRKTSEKVRSDRMTSRSKPST